MSIILKITDKWDFNETKLLWTIDNRQSHTPVEQCYKDKFNKRRK